MASPALLVINPTPGADRRRTAIARAREAHRDEASSRRSRSPSRSRSTAHWVTLRANVDLPEEAEQPRTAAPKASGSCAPSFSSSDAPRCPTRRSSTARTGTSSRRSADSPSSFAPSMSAATSCPSAAIRPRPNPFLGWRAIRMCLDEPELFKTQLRALLRAAMHGDVRIMLPLIITLDEVRQAKQLLKEAAASWMRGASSTATIFRSASWSRRRPRRCRRDTLVDDVVVLQHRHERSRAVHARGRSRERESRIALHAAASGCSDAHQADRRCRSATAWK